MPRGGKRNGIAGKAYPQRADLTPTAAPGQTYGNATQQLQAQQTMPMGAQPPPSPGGAVGEAAPPGPLPGSLGPLNAPTQRPDEPLTAGAPTGPGPNSMTLPSAPDPLTQGLVFLNQIPNLPTSLALIRDQLRVQSR